MRFEREARTLAALSHPNIVTIHDVGLRWPEHPDAAAWNLRDLDALGPDDMTRPRYCCEENVESSRHLLLENRAHDVAVVRVEGLRQRDGKTFAHLEAIKALDDGEAMFIEDGFHMSVRHAPPPLCVVRSRLHWASVRWRFRH